MNDAAERAMKDISDYARTTTDPVLRNAIIILANDHRGRVTNMKKGNLDAL